MTVPLPTPAMTSAGDGPPVVLLHPLGVDRTVWRPVEESVPGYRFLTYDLPGHGAAPAPRERCTVEDLSDQLADLLRAADLGPAHVVGVSLGGLVAQALAAREPRLVDHLVVVDAVAVYPAAMRDMWRERAALVRARGIEPVVVATLELWFTAGALERDDHVVRTVRSLLSGTDPEGYARACEVLETADTTGLLDRITAPTMVVCGEDDAPAFTTAASRLAEAVAHGRLEWLSGARHAGAFEHPSEFAALLASFLPAAVTPSG
ncbi:MAG: alpha/beta fold hydrolase [Nocardioidaceae bacterium]